MNETNLPEIQRLASLYFDNDLDVSGVNELSKLLEGNEEACIAYLSLLTIHSDMQLMQDVSSTHTETQLDSQLQSTHLAASLLRDSNPNGSNPNGSKLQVNQPEVNQPQSVYRQSFGKEANASRFSWSRYAFIGFAASIATLLVSLAWLDSSDTSVESRQAGSQVEASGTPLPSPLSDHVAQIIRKVDCDWEGDRWAVVSSSDLFPGQTLTMSRGLMELEFTSGAKVTLEAPVSFRVESAMRGVLSHGKLTANIPKSAYGFTVSTPNGETIDLGTRFGMFVDETGKTETHVFEGEVIVRPLGDDVESHETRLKDDMALRVASDNVEPTTFTAVSKRFTNLDFEEDGSELVPAIDRKLTLWLSADRRLQLDESDHVTAWGDLCTKDNQAIQNAWQVDLNKRPSWIENSIGGHPSVRFDGKQYMVSEPLEIGAEQTIATVFRIDSAKVAREGSNAAVGRQLLNMNGPPHLVLTINKKQRVESRIFAGSVDSSKGGKDYLIAGRTASKRAIGDKPVVVVSVYNPTKKFSKLYLNGKLIDESGARGLKPTNSTRYIGSHMFLSKTQFIGDVAELMIYNAGLTDQEAQSLSATLIEKYKIETEASDRPLSKDRDRS